MIDPPFLPTPVDGSQGGKLNIDPSTTFKLSLGPNSTSSIYDAYVRFFYDEIKDGETMSKSIDWQLLKNDDKFEINERSEAFYSLLANSLEEDPNIIRFQRGASFTLVTGAQEIADYIRIGRANLGITSSGEVPVYQGSLSYGFGLFSSRYTELRDELELTQITRDSIALGPITGSLGFQ